MGIQSTKNDSKKDLNKEVPNNQKNEFQNSKENKINYKTKRKYPLSIDNDKEEKDLCENLNNKLNSNLCMENSIINYKKEG